MIAFDTFHPESGRPIYLELLLYLKRGIVSGTIRDGDELPSRRMVSATLGMNPNTVQKAFRQLEEEGLIESRTGAKSVITLNEGKIESLRAELLSEEIRGVTKKLRQMGISREEALKLIDRYWEEE